MRVELTEALWLEEGHGLSLAELKELSGLSDADLTELLEYGALAPTDREASTWTFNAECLVAARTACRLRKDFDLDPPALALALTLLERIRELEGELCALRARLPHSYL